MKLDIRFDYLKYVKKQTDLFFPDGESICDKYLSISLKNTFERLEYCFDRIAANNFDVFNHLHTDQYAMFLYILSNELYKNAENKKFALKIMYLNKCLNSLNCMYDNELPDVFCFIHIVGSVIGKANFGNYLVIHQNVTIGANNGIYPTFGDNVSLFAGASVIGNCNISSNVKIGAGVILLDKDVPDNSNVVLGDNSIKIINSRKNFSKFVFK